MSSQAQTTKSSNSVSLLIICMSFPTESHVWKQQKCSNCSEKLFSSFTCLWCVCRAAISLNACHDLEYKSNSQNGEIRYLLTCLIYFHYCQLEPILSVVLYLNIQRFIITCQHRKHSKKKLLSVKTSAAYYKLRGNLEQV